MSAAIPVRVPPGARPPRATAEPKYIHRDHALAVAGCPVCNGVLADRLVHLVVVGSIDNQPGPDGQLATAVLVHAECALPAPEASSAAVTDGTEDPGEPGPEPCCGPATVGRCETCGTHWHRGHRLRPLNPG